MDAANNTSAPALRRDAVRYWLYAAARGTIR
jgi:hypothetical protein